MFCIHCGKEIPEGSAYCPECGGVQKVEEVPVTDAPLSPMAEPDPAPAPLAKTKYNALSIVGFVIGLVSWFLNFWGLMGIAALVVSILGLLGCHRKNEKGMVFAIVGICSGVVNIIYAIVTMSQAGLL